MPSTNPAGHIRIGASGTIPMIEIWVAILARSPRLHHGKGRPTRLITPEIERTEARHPPLAGQPLPREMRHAIQLSGGLADGGIR
jgi:hypothetical protein